MDIRRPLSRFHSWFGLPLSWMLFFIFATGTLSFYRNEITFWMQPELHQVRQDDQGLDRALGVLENMASGAERWTINPPSERNPAISLAWTNPGGDARRPERKNLDPASGKTIEPRKTNGGNFFFRLHFELFGLDHTTGRMITGFAAMAMFALIVSGIVIHRTLLKEFFTFRPKTNRVLWRDAHNVTAVLALPFHLVITFSGMTLLAPLLMPSAFTPHYSDNIRAFYMESRGFRPAERQKQDQPAALPDVAAMIDKARNQWRGNEVGSIAINNPGRVGSIVELKPSHALSISIPSAGGGLRFDAKSGDMLKDESDIASSSVAMAFWNSINSIHLGRFAPPPMRFLLFLSGMLGTAMIAAGLISWHIIRAQRRKPGDSVPASHRLVEILNIAFIAGLPLAMIGFFWANRLIPAEIQNRAGMEENIFFLLWGLCFIHAALRRPHVKAWCEQLGIAGLMGLSLPLLNGLTGGAHLGESLPSGLWPVAGFDCLALIIGGGLAAIACFLWKRAGSANSRGEKPC